MIGELRADAVQRLNRAEERIAICFARLLLEHIMGINQVDHGVTSLPEVSCRVAGGRPAGRP